MQHATKMVMVPQEIYSGLLSKENQSFPPLVGQLANLDQQLSSIISNPSLSTDAKYQLYQQTFSRYQHLKNQQFPLNRNNINNSAGAVDISTIPKIPLSTQTDYEIDETGIVSGLPKTVRRKGKILLDHLKKQNLQFTSTGELIDPNTGKLIPGSNFTDLVHYATRNRPTLQPPTGGGEFMNFLLKTNVPREAINYIVDKHDGSFSGAAVAEEEKFMTPAIGTLYSPSSQPGTSQRKTPKTPKSSQSGTKVGVKTRRYNKLSPVDTPKNPRNRNPPKRYGQFIEQS